MMDNLFKSFQFSTLCVAIACANTTAFALENLEKLDDVELGDSTGEGIALLPQDFSITMNAPRDDNTVGYGGGSVRLIPVGPLSTTATAKGYSKADGWLYGVSLAQSKDNYNQAIDQNDWGVPFGKVALTGQALGATDFGRGIESWGTAENPWIIKANTAPDIPNFKGVNGEVAYFTLEAPLRHNSLTSLSSGELSAYNLKLGMWADFFMRNNALTESTNSNALDSALSNRLRLALVWDGFGINGSNIKLFQTLGGVDDVNKGGTYTASLKINGVEGQLRTFNYGMDKSYNSTLGFSGLLRLNSGVTDAKRGTVSNQTVLRSIHQVTYNALTGYNSTSNSRSGSYSIAPTPLLQPKQEIGRAHV